MGLLIYVLVVFFFALWLTVHVRLCLRLTQQRIAHALLALILPPLAPYFAYRAQLKRQLIIWCSAAGAYTLAITFAYLA